MLHSFTTVLSSHNTTNMSSDFTTTHKVVPPSPSLDHGNVSVENGTFVGALEDYSLPIYAQVSLIFLYTAMCIVAVGGNGIVCYIVLAYQRMRTVTNYFIVNLACSDILMAILCIPFSFVANMILHYWPFGKIMCPVVTYAQVVSVFLSAFTLVAISLDRYVAIIYPLRPRMTSSQAGIVIAMIWVLSLTVPLPTAILSRVVLRTDYTGVNRTYCEEIWTDNNHRYAYSMTIMILQYFLPLFVLIFTYLRIGIVIWVKKPPGEAENNRDQRMAASKRKMVKMMITVVIIYAICWLPLHTVTLVGDQHPEIYNSSYMNLVWISCHWLAMSNSCYNPVIYCWMNSKYRSGFKYALRWCPCSCIGFSNTADREEGPNMKRANTYLTSVRTSVTVTGRLNSPFPRRYLDDPSTSGSGEKENPEAVPLHKLGNGLYRSGQLGRTSDHGYFSSEPIGSQTEKALLSPV